MRYTRFHGVRVSKRWYAVLRRAEDAGYKFTLNSGHRTMTEQLSLFRQNMQFVAGRWIRRPGRPLTAKPTPNAPHIRLGRAAHALDVDTTNGGAAGLARFLRLRGVHVAFPVPGEPWHLEISEDDLTRLWRQYR